MNKKGFTVLEMILVLSVISLIFLITLPNIQQKETIIRRKGCEALIEVVNSQILLYEIDTLETPTGIDQLISGNYIKDSQRRCPDGRMIEISDGEAYVQ